MEHALAKIIAFLFFILWMALYIKQLLFWLWLWQLKEYHFGRLKAHFETQPLKKIISSLYRIKYPKFTKKIILISIVGFSLAIIVMWQAFSFIALVDFYLFLLIAIVLSPVAISLIVMLFQIPSVIWQNRIMEKATAKISRFKNLTVIGITGSFGKTSTKEFLADILSEKYNVLKTENHINAEIGIAKTILEKLNESHQIFIAEIGAYERGKIRQVCRMLKPKIGILTGINEQHMSTFGSQENIVKAKFELIESLPEEGVGILNGANEKIISNYKTQILNSSTNSPYQNTDFKLRITDIKEKSDLWPENIMVEKEKISFKARSKTGETADFELNLTGAQNIPNILLAVACCMELGMSLAEIAEICSKIQNSQEGLKIKQWNNGAVILDSTYSANPDGVLADLQHLKLWQGGKKIIIMPCLIELGKASQKVHSSIGQGIGKVCDLAIITTKDRFKELKSGAIESGMTKDKILFIENPDEILAKLKASSIATGCMILLESRVPEKIKQLLLGN